MCIWIVYIQERGMEGVLGQHTTDVRLQGSQCILLVGNRGPVCPEAESKVVILWDQPVGAVDRVERVYSAGMGFRLLVRKGWNRSLQGGETDDGGPRRRIEKDLI